MTRLSVGIDSLYEIGWAARFRILIQNAVEHLGPLPLQQPFHSCPGEELTEGTTELSLLAGFRNRADVPIALVVTSVLFKERRMTASYVRAVIGFSLPAALTRGITPP
jgi:hypothetical protein